jgi:predicted negative regulator of RcsB-dependent stress response
MVELIAAIFGIVGGLFGFWTWFDNRRLNRSKASEESLQKAKEKLQAEDEEVRTKQLREKHLRNLQNGPPAGPNSWMG